MRDALNVLIVAADPLARSALAAICEDLPAFLVAGLANPSTVEDHIEELQENSAVDLIIWDLGWETGGFVPDEFQGPSIPLMLLVSDSEQAEEAWSAVPRAILKREASGDMLEAAALAAVNGLLSVDPDLTLPFLRSSSDAQELEEPLTPREMEVLRLLAEGMTNNAIANDLGISHHTVKFHVNAILGKLNAQSRTEAVVSATRHGLLAL